MTEVLFYHLTRARADQALPGLLERSLERGWKATVQTESEEQLKDLDQKLWTYRDDSFLPHASQQGAAGSHDDQPIWLTIGTDNPNNANIRFVLGAAVPTGIESYERVIYMFDGHDENAVAAARERWKIEKKAGHELTYWQQDEEGRWKKSA